MPVYQPIGFEAVVDISGIVETAKAISKPQEREQLLNRWADDYFQSVNARHRTLSKGGLSWRPLEPSTLRGRRKRNNQSTDILKDTGQLLAATRKKGGPGQVRRLNPGRFSVEMGFSASKVYDDPVDRKKPRNISLAQLAFYHATGQGNNNKRRTILVPPNQKTLDKFKLSALTWLRRVSKNV